MAHLFADENFPPSAVLGLRVLGHLVVTASEAGLANKRIPDEIVLEYATRMGYAVLTHNWTISPLCTTGILRTPALLPAK